MDNKPAVSIVVPIYKVEAYLKQCVTSILHQTFRDFELILVDDGSPDKCGVICDGFAATDSRIRVLHKENGGLASAIIAGCSIAQGSYFGFVDSDDWIEPQMFSQMYDCAVQRGADIVTCGYIYDYGNKQSKVGAGETMCFDKEQIITVLLPELLNVYGWRENIFSNSRCDKLYRAQLIQENLGFYNSQISAGEDLNFTFSALLDANKVICLGNAYFYHYRVRADSITRSYNPHLWKNNQLLIASLLAIADAKKSSAKIRSLIIPTFVYAAVRYELDSNIAFCDKHRKIKRILYENPEPRLIPLLRQTARKATDKLFLFLLEHGQIACLLLLSKLQKARVSVLNQTNA